MKGYITFVTAFLVWFLIVSLIRTHLSDKTVNLILDVCSGALHWSGVLIGTVPLFLIFVFLRGPVSGLGWQPYKWALFVTTGAFAIYYKLSYRLGGFLSALITLPWVAFTVSAIFLPLLYTWPINAVLAFEIAVIFITSVGYKPDLAGDEGVKEKRVQLNMMAHVTRATMSPVAVGTWGVFWMTLLFNIFDGNESVIRRYETHLAYVSREAKFWLDFSPLASVGLALALVALAVVMPRWRPVTRIASIKEWSERVLAVLAVLTSFTFLQQAPSKYEDWKEHRRIQAERTDKPDEQAKNIAEQVTENAIRSLQPSRLAEYREMFKMLEDRFPYPRHERIIEEMTKPVNSISPATVSATASLGHKSDETLEGLQNLFCELISAVTPKISVTPELRGIAGKFIEHLVDQESERVFDVYIKPKVQMPIERILGDEVAIELSALRVNQDSTEATGTSETPEEKISRLGRELEDFADKAERPTVNTEMMREMERPRESERPPERVP